MLDRPRHEEAVRELREVGAKIRFITDGDVAASLLAVTQDIGVDLLWGVGGTPEGVLSAAAIKCLGGRILGRLWPRDEDERKAAEDAGYDLDRVLDVDDLVGGNDVFFAATGVTDGDLLAGVRYMSGGRATTESLVMRSRSGTVRKVAGDPRPPQAARGHRRALRLALALVGPAPSLLPWRRSNAPSSPARPGTSAASSRPSWRAAGHLPVAWRATQAALGT